MKQNLLFAFLAYVVVAMCATAQNRIVNISFEDAHNAQLCGGFLEEHPSDTLITKYNVQKSNQRGCVVRRVYLDNDSLAAVSDTTWYVQQARKISVDKEQGYVTVTSKLVNNVGEVTPDTVRWNVTNTSDISFETKESICRGETRIFDPGHKDYDGNFRHKTQVSFLGGGAFYVNDGVFTPSAGGRISYESCHFLFEVQGSVMFNNYTEVASETGKYMSLEALLNLGWKFWQDQSYRHYLAVFGQAGYMLQKTDIDSYYAKSQNYGLAFGLGVRGSLGVSKDWRVFGEAGYEVVPKVRHNEQQDLTYGAVFVNVGIGYVW